MAGFWPSLFRPLGTGSLLHSLHGVTATLWVVTLALQSWLVSQGLVRWHRRVVMVFSARQIVAVMATNPNMPPFLPPILAFIDLPSVMFLVVLVAAAPPSARTGLAQALDSGERRLAYPLSLGFFAAVHVLMFPMGSSAAWGAFYSSYAGPPVFAR